MRLQRLPIPLALALAGALALAPARGFAEPAEVPEEQLKAAFLYNFSLFVTWPSEGADSARAFRISVIDDDSVAEALRTMLAAKTRAGRPIEVESARTAAECRGSEIVFFGGSADSAIAGILDALKGRHVLTVGTHPEFLEMGGIIHFARVDERLQFDVDLGAARRNGLDVSSRLLQVARAVRGREAG